RPAHGIVGVKVAVRALFAQHGRQQLGKMIGVMNAAIEPEPANGVVDVRGVASEKYTAVPEIRCNTLVHAIYVAMDDLIAPRLREKFLKAGFGRLLVKDFFISLAGQRREDRTPAA